MHDEVTNFYDSGLAKGEGGSGAGNNSEERAAAVVEMMMDLGVLSRCWY